LIGVAAARAALAALAASASASLPAPPAPPDPPIHDWPIDFGPERVALTKEYLREHAGLPGDTIEIEPRMIVVHWTGGPSVDAAFHTFAPARLGKGRPTLARASALNVSAHFLVARDGTIHRLMPETWMARHVVGLNHLALGIENAGGPKAPLTAAQLAADEVLVRWLVARHAGIRWLIGHYESNGFDRSELWREKDSHYRTKKGDPGKAFMAALRARVGDLGLLYRPE
jgi:N-acetyl-anhydromuramyl-L-alanine amidase AmpD